MTNPNVWSRIKLRQGDITECKADAIVNAANDQLRGGGGVDGAIHRAAGSKLIEVCKALGGCPTGSAKITEGFNLPARYVIHAVGPVYQDGLSGESEFLRSAYQTTFQLAADHHCRTIALPAISCGVYGYPHEQAAQIAFTAAAEHLWVNDLPETAVWILFTPEIHAVFSDVQSQLERKPRPDRTS